MFKGYAAYGKDEPLKPYEYQPRILGDEDVTIKVICCGICGSDLHTIDSGWGPTKYPCIVGHEIVGHVVEKGVKVVNLAIGDRVGVGAMCWACLEPDCEQCKNGKDNLCPRAVGTYNSKYADGHQSQGGYSDFVRVRSQFAVKIPDSLPSDVAAPLLCAGVTVYSPLKRFGAGPGKRVGVAGIGGLGHLAIQFASKMGAETVAISTTPTKAADAQTLGASAFHVINPPKGSPKKRLPPLDLLIVTAVDRRTGSLDPLLRLLKPDGVLVLVDVPERPVVMNPAGLVVGQKGIWGAVLDR
ncbi:chaperonin 10-like protein [Chytridium lagenaria]|nr:chaperonin 10-like protein [Chytridium lagenaria]